LTLTLSLNMDLDFLRQARDRFLMTSTVFLGLPGATGPAAPSAAAVGQPRRLLIRQDLDRCSVIRGPGLSA